ncbi:MAG: DNA/RNA helicase domain-containing protein, partial [Mycoplasma sp.]
ARYDNGELSHPAYEAFDYLDILKNRFSDINDLFNLSSIAYLPNFFPTNDNPLFHNKYKEIISKIMVYDQSNENQLIDYLKDRFKNKIDINEIDKLDSLDYKPSKEFIEHLKDEFKEIKLVGSQRIAFEKFVWTVEQMEKTNKKFLIAVKGCAGSGKSVVAFKMMLYLRTKKALANLILPGPEFREAVIRTFGNNVASEFITGANYNAKIDFAIVDEAHKATGRDSAKIFYERFIPNINKMLIALIDDRQVINKKGITLEELKEIAHKNNFGIVELDLEEQFRNGGDASYTNWLKNILFDEDNGQEFFTNNFYKFNILDEKEFNQTYQDMYDKHNVRLVSFWTQTWDLNNLSPTVEIGSCKYIWNPNWQWLSKYTGAKTKELNKLCNVLNFNLNKKGHQYVAYFNTIQGYEFDYIFVHVPKLFTYRDGEIKVNIEELDMSEMRSQIWSLNGKSLGEIKKLSKLNSLYFLNRLFVNLTRGTKGTYVYFEDEELEKYFRGKIS